MNFFTKWRQARRHKRKLAQADRLAVDFVRVCAKHIILGKDAGNRSTVATVVWAPSPYVADNYALRHDLGFYQMIADAMTARGLKQVEVPYWDPHASSVGEEGVVFTISWG